MAKDAKPAEEGAEGAPKKSKKMLIIILAVVLLLVVAIGAGAFLMLSKGDPEADEDGEVAEETTKAKKKDKKKDKAAPPVFVNLDPFTVNLIPEVGDQYLQVVLALELEGPESEPDLKLQMPKVRNTLTLLLSSQKPSELLPKEGKEKLAEQIRDEINMIMEPPVKNKKGEVIAPDGPVKSVLFTSFIIQ
jgi:flagellar protein FliL